ncbi:ATP-binding cassette domain-containing protein, partial [bacterium]|nr:ATP-binding cassette domain-containing protein [bacterium]
MIKINNLDVFIGNTQIIDQVSFTVEKPAIIGFLGPNGAGKSTLLNAICGLPSYKIKGEIEIFGKSIKDWSYQELSKHRAILPQRFDLPFPFKVNEVVLMGSYPHNLGKLSKIDLSLLENVLIEMDIVDLKDRFFTSLSGGQKQRVLIAR